MNSRSLIGAKAPPSNWSDDRQAPARAEASAGGGAFAQPATSNTAVRSSKRQCVRVILTSLVESDAHLLCPSKSLQSGRSGGRCATSRCPLRQLSANRFARLVVYVRLGQQRINGP